MINEKNLVFVTVGKNNSCHYYECLFNSKALNVPLINISYEDINKLNDFENIFFYPEPLIYFGGNVNKFEMESIFLLEFCKKTNKNLIIFVDTIYDTIDRYKIGLKHLDKDVFEIPYKKISQKDFPVINSRYFSDIMDINKFPFMNLYYGANNYKFRNPSFQKFITPGDCNFYVQGGCCKLVPDSSKINKFSNKKISYGNYLENLNNSLCTILIYDERWKKQNLILPSWRFIESYSSNCICFIEDRVDENKTYINDDFFYVSNFTQLKEKIEVLATDFNFREKMLNKQLDVVNSFDKKSFTKNYYEYLNSLK